MDRIIQNYESAIEKVQSRMLSGHSSVVSLAPRSTGTVSPDEERIAESIDAIDVIKDRYRCATEYMSWFMPAWDTLNDTERFILSELYQNGNTTRSNLISNLSRELYLERAQIYRRKDKALEHLTLLLYGL